MQNEYLSADEVAENRTREIREVTDYLTDYIRRYEALSHAAADPAVNEQAMALLRETPIPEAGRPLREVGEELIENVFKTSQYVHNPKYMAFVPNAASPYSVAGAVMTDVFNIYAGANLFSQGAAIIEKRLIAYLGALAGFPESCGGVFTSGGSLSTLTGMIAARSSLLREEDYPRGTAYYSDQAHSSVRKGMMLMGMRRDRMREIPTDENCRIRLDALEAQIRADLHAGLRPFLLVSSLGTTNTGSIDPLRALGALAQKYGMWLHIDGAYGGSLLFSEKQRHLADGLALADSLTWDQHKWGLQTYSCSCIIAKDRAKLLRSFAEHPEYLADIRDDADADGWDLGIEMTRPARAIKLWVTLQTLGTRKLAAVIDRTFYTVGVAESLLRAMPDWEITSAPSCGAITFRYAPKSLSPEAYDALNAEIVRCCNAETDAYLATTVIHGMRVVRLCVINSNVTDRDVRETLASLDGIARRLTAQS